MNSRDALHTLSGVRAFEQARDPATTGAGVMVAARRSNLIAGRGSSPFNVRRSPCVGGVIPTVLDVSSCLPNCAGPFTGAGDFFVPSREDRLSDPAVIARSGVAAPFVKMRVPVCKSPSLEKESDR